MNSITVKAYAKINLGLDVLRKREDGYHDVCMIMQSIDLYDTITITKVNWQTDSFDRYQSASEMISVETTLTYLPNDQGNLVYKAAALFLETISVKEGLHIELYKKIPVAAGLAGGSADAAATLRGLNELYHAGMSMEDLMNLGVTLGADVPYCIRMGTALSEGIGEVLTPLAPMPACAILLVKPDINVSTKYVYENLKLNVPVIHPDITTMKMALAEGDIFTLSKSMDNILQTVTIPNYPIIADIKDQMMQLGALTSLMSGSGPTVFGIYTDPKLADQAFHFFKTHGNYGKQVFLSRPYWPET